MYHEVLKFTSQVNFVDMKTIVLWEFSDYMYRRIYRTYACCCDQPGLFASNTKDEQSSVSPVTVTDEVSASTNEDIEAHMKVELRAWTETQSSWRMKKCIDGCTPIWRWARFSQPGEDDIITSAPGEDYSPNN